MGQSAQEAPCWCPPFTLKTLEPETGATGDDEAPSRPPDALGCCNFPRPRIVCDVPARDRSAPQASANVTYTYTGDPFTYFTGSMPPQCPPLCRVTGSFTVVAALPVNLSSNQQYSPSPISFSFTDGVNTYSPSNSYFIFFFGGTVAVGRITSWQLDLHMLPNTSYTNIETLSGTGAYGDATQTEVNYALYALAEGPAESSDSCGRATFLGPYHTPLTPGH